jgi:hypothetical protein
MKGTSFEAGVLFLAFQKPFFFLSCQQPMPGAAGSNKKNNFFGKA